LNNAALVEEVPMSMAKNVLIAIYPELFQGDPDGCPLVDDFVQVNQHWKVSGIQQPSGFKPG
jgi:hypothetical protein